MKPPRFAYYDPATVAEAVELKGRFGPAARVLAGGQSLMQDLNTRRTKPDALQGGVGSHVGLGRHGRLPSWARCTAWRTARWVTVVARCRR